MGPARAGGRGPEASDRRGRDVLRDDGGVPADARQRSGVGAVAVRSSGCPRRRDPCRPRSSCWASRMRAPILLAPCAFAGHAHPDGELAVARAAAASDTTYVVSTASTHAARRRCPSRAPDRCWLQLYVPRDDEQLAPRLAQAAEAGFGAVVVTLDAPVGVDPAARLRSRSRGRRSGAARPSARVAAQPVGDMGDDRTHRRPHVAAGAGERGPARRRCAAPRSSTGARA